MKKSPLILRERKKKLFNIVLFVPALLACFSNYFTLIYPGYYFEFSFSFDLLLAILLSFCVAFNEEYFFRMIIIDNLDAKERPFVKVIISASFFGVLFAVIYFSSYEVVYF